MQQQAQPTGFGRRVAAEVRASLARRGMGKADLGRILEVTPPTAARRWSGAQPYSVDELERIALALDVPVMALVPELEPGGAA